MCRRMTHMLNVHDFPRPPAIEADHRPIRIDFAGEAIARSDSAWRILETSHPPTYYLPLTSFRPGVLVEDRRRSVCEWKGPAVYYSIVLGGRVASAAAWGYLDPATPYQALRGHVAVYAGKMDACFLGGERVRPQPGGFYGGWITEDLIGPFKGGPGTEFW